MSVAVVPTPTTIKAIQRGFIQMTAGQATKSTTITAVNTARAELSLLGVNVASGGSVSDSTAAIKLTNATTIWATRLTSGVALDLEWELTEWQ